MTEPITVGDDSFEEMVLKSKTPVLVDFWATWCHPCQMIAPVLDELAGEYGDRLIVARVDVDQNPRTASKYGVMSIPTLLLFKDGEPFLHMVGFKPKAELKQNIDNALE